MQFKNPEMRFLPLLLILLLSVAALNFLRAQCPPSGVYEARTQTEVDAFTQLYPECTELSVRLYLNKEIGQTDDFISDLSPFNNLTEVGSLIIGNMNSLNDLTGLENLNEVDYLYLQSCPSIASLAGLEGLNRVSRVLINYCNSLSTLEGLNNIEGTIDLTINEPGPDLDIATLPVGAVYNNLSLSNFDIQSLDELPQGFEFAAGANLNLYSMSQLTTIGGPGFPDTLGNVRLISCHELLSLNDFNDVEGIDQIYLHNNQGLTELLGFESLGYLDSMSIANNPLLSTLPSSFNTIENVNRISLVNNPELTTLNGAFAEVNSLEKLRIDRQLPVFFTELNHLSEIGLLFVSSVDLTDLSVFSELQDLERLYLFGLDSLTSVNGITLPPGDSLTELRMFDLPQITSIGGLPPLAKGALLLMRENSQLPFCGVANICSGYPYHPESLLQYNPAGCNSISELLSSCDSGGPSEVREPTNTKSIIVFPNPADHLLTITGLEKDENILTVTIHDYLGRLVRRIDATGKRMSVSDLSPGFYNLRVELANGETGVAKFVKH